MFHDDTGTSLFFNELTTGFVDWHLRHDWSSITVTVTVAAGASAWWRTKYAATATIIMIPRITPTTALLSLFVKIT